jgi:adenylylsulfate kinase
MEENKKSNFVLWLTGLSASGKTTIAKALKERLVNHFEKVHHLDGDEVRDASPVKLGFFKEDRDKNIKLAIELAKKYQDDGYVVIASFISPYKHHREWGRQRLDNYLEVFINCPLEICEERDPKGMYKKARAGEIELFTGITDPYEHPENPDIHIKTDIWTIKESVEQALKHLEESGYI